MDTEIIRQKIFDYVKVAGDEKLEAIYTIIKDDGAEPYEWLNDDELIAELDRNVLHIFHTSRNPKFKFKRK